MICWRYGHESSSRQIVAAVLNIINMTTQTQEETKALQDPNRVCHQSAWILNFELNWILDYATWVPSYSKVSNHWTFKATPTLSQAAWVYCIFNPKLVRHLGVMYQETQSTGAEISSSQSSSVTTDARWCGFPSHCRRQRRRQRQRQRQRLMMIK